MKKIILFAAFALLLMEARAQTCTLTGTGTVNWPANLNTFSCSEGGNATGKTTIVIPSGLTVVFNDNTDDWTGTAIEVYGTIQVTANPTITGNIRVKSGGLLDLQGKLDLGCGNALIVDAGGTVTLGTNAAERLTICNEVIMRGGGEGACNNCGGTYSGQCPYSPMDKPYCQPSGGFTGPSAYDESGYNPTLPVKLLYFNVKNSVGLVALTWSTTMEENFSEFIVQRSADGITYDAIGTVKGQGFNIYDIESKYSFIDEAPLLGMNYYRLKSVDIDNSYEFSEVRAVKMNGSRKLAVYPNPSNGESITFRANFNAQESDRIYLLDHLGVEVFSALAASDDNTIRFSSALKPGVYMLRYVSRDFEQVTRVVVTH